MIRYGYFFQTLEPIIGRGAGHERLPPDGSLVVFLRIDSYVVDQPSGKILKVHARIPFMGSGNGLGLYRVFYAVNDLEFLRVHIRVQRTRLFALEAFILPGAAEASLAGIRMLQFLIEERRPGRGRCQSFSF